MACLCVVPPSVLYPQDTWQTLVPLLSCDWDDLGFVLILEKLGVQFSTEAGQGLPRFLPGRFFWIHRPAPATFGDWAVAVAQHLITHGCRLAKRSS
jgi:hypothetical protein